MNPIENPVTAVDGDIITIYSYVNRLGEPKMVMNKEEATLLYLELHKFIFDDISKDKKN
jgi:hypothetical protein